MGGNIFGTKYVFGAAFGATLAAWTVCAQAQQPSPGLSPQVFQQIQAIAGDKLQRTDAQKKIDPALLFAARAARGQPQFPNAPGISLPQFAVAVGPDGRVLVDIATTDATGLAGPIQSLGGSVISSFPSFNSVRASIPVTALESLAAVSSVRNIRPAEEPHTNRILSPQDSSFDTRSGVVRERLGTALGAQTNVGFGTTISEAVVAHGANFVQNSGITGAGVKVCVMSNGVSSLATRQANGELPITVQILSTGQTGSSGDEGTAMLELVADMAPGASLGFSTGNSSKAQMAQNILDLRNVMGCNIIVDDLTYFSEGAFQEDVIANAVTTVVNNGAMYFSSAANSGHLTGGQSGTWEGDFVDGGAVSGPIATAGETGNFHKFGTSLFDTLTTAASTITLHWSDPLGASGNDYDIFVTDSTGSTLKVFSAAVQNGTQDPFESISCGSNCPAGARVYVVKFSGSARALRVDTNRARLSIATNGSTFGHNGGVNTITVAAVSSNSQPISGREFLATDTTAAYSSDGPRKLFLNPTPATTYITPGCALYSCVGGGGTLLAKVDIAAADCDTTTTPTFIPFCGTSAAAPQAAAIAALVKSSNPMLTNAQVLARMKSTAIDIMAAGVDVDSGAGIVMADRAVGVGGSLVHDFDGNGKSDILWRNANGDTTLWFMNGFQVVSGGSVGNVPTIWSVVGTGDFNGDGKTDILWRNSNGDLTIWLMNGNAVLLGSGLGNVPLSWTIAGVADFDGDHKADILFRNNNGDTSIWFMNGVQVTSGSGLGNIPTAWTSVGTGDFNGDGKADILWRNNNGDLSIWFMNGSQIVSGAGLGNVTTDWGVSGVRDFDGDHKADIVWRNVNGDVAMWFLNGSQVVSGGGLGNIPTSWTIVQTADFDGDGKGDLLWRNANGDASIWLMNGSTILNTGGLGNIPTSWAVQSNNAN